MPALDSADCRSCGFVKVSLGKEINANKNHKDKSKVCYVLYVFICHKLSP